MMLWRGARDLSLFCVCIFLLPSVSLWLPLASSLSPSLSFDLLPFKFSLSPFSPIPLNNDIRN